MNVYRCLGSISLALMLAGCSSGNTSSSPEKSANSISPSASQNTGDSVVQPTDVKVTLTFPSDNSSNFDTDGYCTPGFEPKTDTLGRKLIYCPLQVDINNQSRTEFGFDCDAWLTLSTSERYYFKASTYSDDFQGCGNGQILNPGEAGFLVFDVWLPLNTSISELQIGNLDSSAGTVFKGINKPIPSACATGETPWETTDIICK